MCGFLPFYGANRTQSNMQGFQRKSSHIGLIKTQLHRKHNTRRDMYAVNYIPENALARVPKHIQEECASENSSCCQESDEISD